MMEPKAVFDIFAEICKVPRPSKHEEKISQWLQSFAAAHGIECVADEAMNVIMRVPATPGYEDHEIETYVDGEWLKAKGTTLGADNGIGIAMALAAITDKDLAHPAIECLFTVDEETGLTGAEKLQDGMLKGKRLINLDSEDDGQIFIGCAGGIDTLAKMHYQPINRTSYMDPSYIGVRLSVSGLMGGHSGDDINKGRANANQLIVWFLARIWPQTEIQLASIQGGNLRNAIAREAEATIIIPMSYKEQIRVEWNHYVAQMDGVFGEVEKDMRLDLETTDMPDSVIPSEKAYKLIMALCECPHGMIAMSQDMPGLVETSTNLASIKMKEGYIEINTSQHGDGYPGWAPNPHSPLLETIKKAYIDLYKAEPKVLAIHAGLECGLFLEKYPYLDMVSIGPQMYGVHSPQERLSIPSTERCYRWLCQTLKSL